MLRNRKRRMGRSSNSMLMKRIRQPTNIIIRVAPLLRVFARPANRHIASSTHHKNMHMVRLTRSLLPQTKTEWGKHRVQLGEQIDACFAQKRGSGRALVFCRLPASLVGAICHTRPIAVVSSNSSILNLKACQITNPSALMCVFM